MIIIEGGAMRTRRLAILGPALAVVFVLGGCSPTGGAAAADGSPAARPIVTIPADPAAALAAAGGKLGTQSARFTLSYGEGEFFEMKQSGVVDPVTGRWEITGDGYVIRRIGADLYVKLTKKPEVSPGVYMYEDAVGKWIHSTVPHGAEYSLTFNKDFPWYVARSVADGAEVTRAGDGSYRGKLRAGGSIQIGSTPAKDRSFIAELDGEGRFTRVGLATSDTKVSPTDPVVTYSDFGVTVGITAPPPGEVVEEPTFLFALLGIL